MRLTTIFTAAAVLLLAAPVAGQDGADTTVYTSADVPVWLMVEDVKDDAGAHRVYVAVKWDDHRSKLPFSQQIEAGDLKVFLPKTEDADADDLPYGCRFTSSRMEHGNPGAFPADRADKDCLAPPAASLPLIGNRVHRLAGADGLRAGGAEGRNRGPQGCGTSRATGPIRPKADTTNEQGHEGGRPAPEVPETSTGHCGPRGHAGTGRPGAVAATEAAPPAAGGGGTGSLTHCGRLHPESPAAYPSSEQTHQNDDPRPVLTPSW